MIIRIALLCAAFAAPAFAQPAPPPTAAPAPAPKDDLVRVSIETDKGRIVLALDRGRAPVTTANFLRYVDSHRFDGESFYRAMKVGDSGGLIQGGIRSDARKLYPPVAHEPTSVTGLKHVAGAVSVARLEPGSARADFFILTTDIPAFDATTADPGFAVFGRVVEGMDVVSAIQAAPVSATKGDGPMQGQILEPSVKIVKAARVEAAAK
jgi:peptidyl-prolyl cis-trans isomerase A (cyclophilin A)